MKKWLCLFMALTVLFALSMQVAAAKSTVVDEAGLLDADETERLEEALTEISRKHDIDIVVLTVLSVGERTIEDYAVAYCDENIGENGVLLLVSMSDRQWHFQTAGKCKSRIPDNALEGDFENLLRQGEYYEAFSKFATICDQRMGSFIWIVIGISLVIGAVIGLIVVLVMKSKLKSVRSQSRADLYVGNDRLKLTGQSDIFLYQTVTRRPKPQQNNGGGYRSDSSGRSYGGGGGRF